MKKCVSFLLVVIILFNSGCASVFGERIDNCQRTKGASGTPTRQIRVAALICDIVLGGFIALCIDFATNAIYIPCEAYPGGGHGTSSQLGDVVYLKNGSIIKGTIIENKPNDYIKIQTADGSVFVYKMEEIDKMAKEPIQK